METRLDRTGVDATANNIIRTAPPQPPNSFRKPRQGDLTLSVRYHRSGMRGGVERLAPHDLTRPVGRQGQSTPDVQQAQPERLLRPYLRPA